MLVAAQPAYADDPTTLASQLAQVQQQQAQQQQRLQDLEQQQAAERQSLDSLQAELAARSADLAPVAAQAQALQTQIALTQTRLNQDTGAYRDHLAAFGLDVRHLYKFSGLRWLEFIFTARNFSDLLDRTVYLARFIQAEGAVAKGLHAELTALQQQQQIVHQEQLALQPLLQALQARVDAVAQVVAAAAQYDSHLDAERRQALIALAGLETQGRALQARLDAYLTDQAANALRNPGGAYSATCPPAAPAGSVRFCGHGWGHGVGLGQWGAEGMALMGIGYRAIDQHFYTHTSWATLDTAHTPIHVGILWGAGSYRVVPTGPAELLAGGRATALRAGQAVTLTIAGGLQEVKPLTAATRLAVYTTRGLYHSYRGSIVGQPSGGLLYVINSLPIEDYLRGLGEVPSSWPLEAIKAQIVAARCYALTHLGSTALYDVDDTTRYQVYLGADGESAAQNAAVDQTSGQVLESQGHVIIAFFSASDGGHTANVSDVFGGSLSTYPYLAGVLDPWDIVAPRHTWYTAAYPYSTLERIYFSSADVSTYGHLIGLDLSDRDPSDRLNTVGLRGTHGLKRIGVEAFMRAFNRSSLTGTDVLWNEMFGTSPSNRWPYW